MELKFDKSTDTEHKVELDPKIELAVWKKLSAPAEQKVDFEVLTLFVGNGAPIKVTGKSDKGKKLGKISGEVKRNRFIGRFLIPEDIELDDLVFFEVDLPEHGLWEESNKIPAAPKIIVTNLKWSQAEARRGDEVKLTADVKGVRDGTEATIKIYEYDRDGSHDFITEFPVLVENKKIELDWEYEYHEDTDEIPTEEELQKYGKHYNPPEYFFTVEIDGQKFGEKQESGLLEFKDWIEIELKDPEGKPIGNEQYVLHLPDGKEKNGTLDRNGFAKEEDIPPGKILVEFSSLDASTTSGYQGLGETTQDTMTNTSRQKTAPRAYKGASAGKKVCKVNHGKWLGWESVLVQGKYGPPVSVLFMLVEAIEGTWLSVATRDLGWHRYYKQKDGYGAYERSIVIPISRKDDRSNFDWGPDRKKFNPDMIFPGERFLIRKPPEPVLRPEPLEIEGEYTGPLSDTFEVKSIVGGGVGIGVGAGQVFSITIRNPRTKRERMYTYTGLGSGAGVSLVTPSGWTTVKLEPMKTLGAEPNLFIDVDDFGGGGRVVSLGAGKSGSVFEFNEPMVRMVLEGWEVQLGGEADIVGWWHRR
jgi:hypothetical protein